MSCILTDGRPSDEGSPACHLSALLCSALAIFASACARSVPDPGSGEAYTGVAELIKPAAESTQVHDFGSVLATGQTLRHEFVFKNSGDQPIRLLRATAFTPCCSAIGPVPESIPPEGEARVRVSFRPGYRSGSQAVRFALETNLRDQPIRILVLRSRLFSEWEAVPTDDRPLSLPVGATAKWLLRVTCRCRGSEGLRLPEGVTAGGLVEARFVGPGAAEQHPDGLSESTRTVEVAIAATRRTGTQRGEIAFRWPNGGRRTEVIHWETTPLVRISPSSIVVDGARPLTEHRLVVTSTDRPIRMLKVASPLLARPVDCSSAPKRTHDLLVSLDVSRTGTGAVSNVVFTTDHPQHPELTLSILAPPGRH